MNEEKLLSIIIPSKDRQKYLHSCLHFILSIPSKDFEVIICDNSKDDSFSQHVATLNDNRVKYFYYPQWLSVSENFHKGFEHSTGKYVTMIGDDDALTSYIIDIIKWMEASSINVLLPTFAVYYWPDLTFKYHGDAFSGQLIIPSSRPRDIIELNSKTEFHKCLQRGGTMLGDLPQVYYGVVNREFLIEVNRISGSFVPGASPDMALAASLATILDRFTKIKLPIFIAGNSALSGAGMGAQKNHTGEIEQTLWLPKNTSKEWTPFVPKFWSGPTIWAESCLKAVKAMGKETLLKEFNYLYLYARCFVFHREFNERTFESLDRYTKAFKKNMFVTCLIVGFYFFSIWINRLITFARNRIATSKKFTPTSELRFSNIKDVEGAAKKLDHEIKLQVSALIGKVPE